MKLSDDGKKYVEAEYTAKVQPEVDRWYEPEYREAYAKVSKVGAFGLDADQAKAKYFGLSVERVRRLANGLARIYIDAYQQENKDLDDRDVEDIMQAITNRVGNPQELTGARNSLLAAMHKGRSQRAASDRSVPAKTASREFSFVQDEAIRKILVRDYSELEGLSPDSATKSVLLLAGSILEGLLLDALVAGGKWRPDDALQKSLRDMIGAGVAQGIIREDRVSNALREYRNLVHPAREIRERVTFTQDDAKLARAAVDVAIRDVSAWHVARKT